MKAFIWDFNNVLLDIRSRVETVRDWRDSDVILLWQDVRGSLAELCRLNALYYKKPVVVVQHGRGATRDYLAPNKFPLLADKICVWGDAERRRLMQAGYDDSRIVVTGSPLLSKLRGVERTPHPEKFIVFAPVITSHEERENVKTFWELKKIEYEIAQETLDAHASDLKKCWHASVVDETCATENEIPYDLIRKNFTVISKITEIHDMKLYHGITIKTAQINRSHIEDTIKVLKHADCVVGLEEGTLQLMATYLGIPTVIVDGFEYGAYGGVKEYKTEIIRTPATVFCELKDLKKTILDELNEPEKRAAERLAVVKDEFGDPDSDPVENIIDVASQLAGGDIRKKELTCQASI